MKVIIINGSPRSNGATANLLKYYQQVLSQKGVKTELIHISQLKFSPCRGCCVCYKKGACIYQDQAAELSSQIAESDGIIIGSPTYSSQISGELKLFIDRGHFVIEQLLKNKYVITVTTGENHGSRAANSYLNQLVRYSGGWLCGKLRIKLPFGSQPLDDKKNRQKIKYQVRKMIRVYEQNKQFRLQKMYHYFVFQLGIKPFVLKKGAAYQGIRIRWCRNGTEKPAKD